MKKLVFCCLSVLVLIACGERRMAVLEEDVIGYWAMEFEGTNSTSIVMPDDTICTAGLMFNKDTIYMQVRSDGRLIENKFIGKYHVRDNKLTLVSRYGDKKQCEFNIRDGEMLVLNKDEIEAPVIRLRRIKVNSQSRS
ncbi:MAG: hypothetical protein LBV43_15705 [Prevotella sp.]|jgi:hypothetical protein|nr:hypothetical protein [Prevotella sp.]